MRSEKRNANVKFYILAQFIEIFFAVRHEKINRDKKNQTVVIEKALAYAVVGKKSLPISFSGTLSPAAKAMATLRTERSYISAEIWQTAKKYRLTMKIQYYVMLSKTKHSVQSFLESALE